MRAFLAKLPARDDYYLQSAEGVCTPQGFPPYGYAVVNIGPYREHGYMTFNLEYHTSTPRTCAALTEARQPMLFCEEGTDTTPLVMAQKDDGNSFIVWAIYPDTRAVYIGAYETTFDVQTLRSVVTDPELAELLP